MCYIVFEKAKGRGGTANEYLCKSSHPKGSFSVIRNFPKFTRKRLCWNLFFDKVKFCRSATSLKTTL